jgi:hypothetical protein
MHTYGIPIHEKYFENVVYCDGWITIRADLFYSDVNDCQQCTINRGGTSYIINNWIVAILFFRLNGFLLICVQSLEMWNV